VWWLVIAGGVAVSLSALALRTPRRAPAAAGAAAAAGEGPLEAALETEAALVVDPVPPFALDLAGPGAVAGGSGPAVDGAEVVAP
jgi:hypothetical protein